MTPECTRLKACRPVFGLHRVHYGKLNRCSINRSGSGTGRTCGRSPQVPLA